MKSSHALAIATLMAVSVAACSTGSPGQDASVWKPTSTFADIDSLPETDGATYQDISDVAQKSRLVIVARLDSQPQVYSGADLFGDRPADPDASSNASDLAQYKSMQDSRRIFAAQVKVSRVLKGRSVASKGDTVCVLAEAHVTDVENVVVDPGRVGKNQAVFLMHDVPIATKPFGECYWLNGTRQVGASIVIVGPDDQLVPDPAAHIHLNGQDDATVKGASVAQQLGIATSDGDGN